MVVYENFMFPFGLEVEHMLKFPKMQASLLLCSLLDSWETFVGTISNFVPNGALSMNLVKGNLFNE